MADTSRLGLHIATLAEPANFPAAFNDAMSKIDTQAARDTQGTYANLPDPAATPVGTYYSTTDVTAKGVFRRGPSTWDLVASQAPLLSSVPTGLFEGQRFSFKPDSSNQPNVRWTFELVGGMWLYQSGAALWTDFGSATASTGSSTPANTPQGAGDTLTPKLAGSYEVAWGASLKGNSTGPYTGYLGVGIGASYAQISGPASLVVASQFDGASVARRARPTLAANDALRLTLAVDVAGKSIVASDTHFSILPIRVTA